MVATNTALETGQKSDGLLTEQVNLACAYRANMETIRDGLRDGIAFDPHVQTAIDLIDEASLYLGLAISGYEQPQEFSETPW